MSEDVSYFIRRAIVAVLMTLTVLPVAAQSDGVPGASRLVYAGPDGKLVHAADAQGNTVPDFSTCGYMGGGVSLPEVAARATVEPADGDAGARIQAAIDGVAKLPPDARGLRGAVLLKRGEYRVAGTITIDESGIVLRGEGSGGDGTVLVATGAKTRTLVVVKGSGGATVAASGARITDPYVPVGAKSFRVATVEGLHVGDTVIVRRRSNTEWVHFIGMDRIPERPGNPNSTVQWKPFNLDFDRVITEIRGDRVSVDAPIVCAIEERWGGGEVLAYTDANRIRQVGIEGLRCVSEFDPSVKASNGGKQYAADEKHCDSFVEFDDVVNAWARDLAGLHLVGSCVHLDKGAKWVTVQDCRCEAMVSVLTGGRRYAFYVEGQQCLVQRCFADTARHAFVVGARVCGPNVFLDCRATHNHATSEPHHRWSVGGLYDNVSAAIAIQDRSWMGTGHGWAGANYVVWNCAGDLVCQSPPTAQNWAIGFVGKRNKPAFKGRPDGIWESFGQHVTPRSLYLKQLDDRLGKDAVANTTREAQRQ